MTTAASIPPQTLPREHYLKATYGIRSWLLTTDHKRIALFYLASVKFFFILGSIFAFIIRLNLLTPQGNLVSPDTYNKLFTMHGVARRNGWEYSQSLEFGSYAGQLGAGHAAK